MVELMQPICINLGATGKLNPYGSAIVLILTTKPMTRCGYRLERQSEVFELLERIAFKVVGGLMRAGFQVGRILTFIPNLLQ